MKRPRNDFTVIPNTQKNRTQGDLWDVVAGGDLISTVQGQSKAQELADRLNLDCWYLDRGQTRFERTGTRLSLVQPE